MRQKEPIDLCQALSWANLALSTIMGQLPSKQLGIHKDMRAARILLNELRKGIKMDSDLNFFKTRTKATVPASLPDNARVMLDQLAAGLGALKEKLGEIESRLTALERGTQEEKAVKKNGHLRSFQADITTHSKQVRK